MKYAVAAGAIFLAWLLAGCAGQARELRRKQWLDDVDACMANRQTIDQDCSLREPK